MPCCRAAPWFNGQHSSQRTWLKELFTDDCRVMNFYTINSSSTPDFLCFGVMLIYECCRSDNDTRLNGLVVSYCWGAHKINMNYNTNELHKHICNKSWYVKSTGRKSKLLPGAKMRPVQLTLQDEISACGLMRQHTISMARNTPINDSSTSYSITSKLIEVWRDNSMLQIPFQRCNIAVCMQHIKMW